MRLIDADAITYESVDSCDTGRYESYYGTGILAVRKEDIDEQPTIESEQRWIPVTDHNPEIDMSYPHSEHYLVTYDNGEIDVARWSNVNPFWTDHVTEPRWWGAQYCKVIAWMPLPGPYGERREE